MRKFFRRLHFLLHRRQLEADLAEEMRAHRELVARDRHASFGRELTLREEARKVWGWIWLDRFCQDLRYAARLFRRSPGFTLGAVTVLALGVGANLAEFHVFDALLLHRLNVNGAESIFRLSRNSKDLGASSFPFQTVDFFRESCAQCSFVTAEGGWRDVALETDTNARANFVSGDYFSSLGILPAWGRLLNERDAQPGAPAVAVLGYEYWQNHFGSDPHVIDRIVRINGNPVEIVGVAPYDFDGLQPHSTAAWLAIRQRAALIPGSPPLESYNRADAYLYARPKPGVSLASLEAELTALDRQLAHREPAQFKSGERILAERLPGSGVVARKIPPAVFLLFALALLILLSACANLANMLLARGVARRREIEIRIGLGAGKARVIRQLLTENLLLSVMGCAAGLLAGYVIAHLLVAALGAPPSIRIALHPQILAAQPS